METTDAPVRGAAVAPNKPDFGKEPIARLNTLELRLAITEKELHAAQELRYSIFYEEMSAVPTDEMKALRRDFDEFDPVSDHLIVIDHAAEPRADGSPAVVGTYRLLRQEVAEANSGFYTAGEFDIGPLIAQRPAGTKFLELGRSCTHKDYRNKPTIELLWQGILAYILAYDMDVLIGCGSLDGTDPDKLALQLSYLRQEFTAPPEWSAKAHADRYVSMDRLPPEKIDARAAARHLPPLIKGYLRAGSFVGDGAVIDWQFGTTDVLLIMPVELINARYIERFKKPLDAANSNGHA